MDERVAQIISNIKDWNGLAVFERNARTRNRLTDEVVQALHNQATKIGRGYLADKIKLDLLNLTPAEEKIVEAISEYIGIMHRQGKAASRTLSQIKNLGLLGAAEASVCRATPTQGFETLAESNLEDLSYEKIILDHEDEFSPRALWYAKKTLGLPLDTDKPPADMESITQLRTVDLLSWLEEQAENNSGMIPIFTNADSAHAMGIEDTHKYGRVLGNIQSRIDFACYLCNLPPLGLTADSPFANAWEQNSNHSSAYPIKDMANAAKSHIWSREDFTKIRRETERLPGQAYISWQNESKERILAWATDLSVTNTNSDDRKDEENKSPRNPAWSRDELILALDLYLQHRESPPGKESPEVAELSALLGKLGAALGITNADTFRNTNGVYMKMMNFRRFDPEYIKDGRVGLTRGNKDEQIVWDTFAHTPDKLASIAAAIRAAIEAHGDDKELTGIDEPDIQEAEEGRVLTRIHRVRERNRKLVEAKKAQALKQHGALRCEACGFDFAKKYGEAGQGLIDVHHTKPIHTLAEGDTTKLDELALLCSNCHRVVHATRRWRTVDEVQKMVRKIDSCTI